MADTQTQDTAPSPDIGSMLGTDQSLLSGFQGLYKAKAAEDAKITAQADKRQAVDQGRLEQAYKQEGIDLNNLPQPWNAEQEHKKWETNPIEGFGSVGGLFAMVASAFTKAPMENAIGGMAAAINSIKEGNEAGYERAHQAWQENTKLALERFKTQHELYQDAMSMFDHDQAAANAKLHNAAVRFGDNQMMMLAEHGMVKEMFELQASRAQAASQMMELQDKMTQHEFTKSALGAMQKGFQTTGDPNKDKIIIATQAMKILSGGQKIGSAEQEAVGQYVMTHNPSDPNFSAGLADLHQKFSPRAPNIEAYQQAKQEIIDRDGSISEEKDADLLQKFGLSGRPGIAGGTGTSSQAIKARAIKEIQDKNPGMSTAEAEHQYNVTRAAPTGNQIDSLQGRIDQADRVIEGSEENLNFLRSYKGGAGLMGKIMRGEEIAENITGVGTQTDRVAFRRRVNELREMAPRILVDSNGRPLKAEQDKVADIVAGLESGDTTPNTIRAYEDLVKEMKVRIQKYRERQGKAAPTSSAGDGAPAGNTDWLSAYPEKR